MFIFERPKSRTGMFLVGAICFTFLLIVFVIGVIVSSINNMGAEQTVSTSDTETRYEPEALNKLTAKAPQPTTTIPPATTSTTTTTIAPTTSTTTEAPKKEKSKVKKKKNQKKNKNKNKNKQTVSTTTTIKKDVPGKNEKVSTAPVSSLDGKFVTEKGNDKNPGTQEAPWKSLQKGINNLNPGETLWVGDGTYTEHTNGSAHYIINNPNASDWKRIKAIPGTNPKIVATKTSGVEIAGNYVEFSGFTIEGRGFTMHDYGYGIVAKDGHHFILNGNKISGMPNGGIAGAKGSHYHIEGNEVFDNAWYNDDGGSGISLWRLTNLTDHGDFSNKILKNTAYRNENFLPCNCVDGRGITDGNGIIIDQSNHGGYKGRTLIEGNVVQNNGGRGINVHDSSNVTVQANVATNNSLTLELLGENAEIAAYNSFNVVIRNNSLEPTPGIVPVSVEGGDVNVYDNNIQK